MAERVRRYLIVSEAALLLIAAKFLVAVIAMRRWRASLGRVAVSDDASAPSPAAAPIVKQVVSAINVAQTRLHHGFLCLPRAMATQWMLRRRGVPSQLVFGIARGTSEGKLHDYHAWVEADGRIVIGGPLEQAFHRGLVLRQP